MNSFLKSFLTGGAILLLTIAGSSVIEAKEGGTGVGNGGDAVVCHDASGGIKSVEFFDLFEMRMIYDRALKLEAGTPLDKVRGVARKISMYFPNLAKEMIDHAEQFTARTEWVRRDLQDIPDAGDVIFPSGCRIKQVIIRSKQLPYPGKLFEIDQRLWERMDVDSRAAAILHEFIYGLAVDRYGHSNSVASRRVNAELMSDYLGEPGAWVDWVHLFASQKIWVKVDSSYTVDSGNHFDVPEPLTEGFLKVSDGKVTVWGTLPKPVDFSTSQGERRMAPGPYVLVKERGAKGAGLVTAKGNLQGSHQLMTAAGRISLESSGVNAFSEVGDYGQPRFQVPRLSSARLRFERLTTDRLTVIADPDCSWNADSLEVLRSSLSIKGMREGRRRSGREAPCTITVVTPEFSIEGTEPGDLTRQSNFHVSLQVVGGKLKWIHGEKELKADTYVHFWKDPWGQSDLASLFTTPLHGEEELGRLPEWRCGDTVYRDLPIRSASFKNGIPVDYRFIGVDTECARTFSGGEKS